MDMGAWQWPCWRRQGQQRLQEEDTDFPAPRGTSPLTTSVFRLPMDVLSDGKVKVRHPAFSGVPLIS